MTFQVIVSETGTRKNELACVLQHKLSLFRADDPFLVKSSNVVEYLRENQDKEISACPIDVQDLYYSMPQAALTLCIEDCIDNYGVIAFQTQTGILSGGFLELLALYLRSTYVECDRLIYLQK